MKKLFLNVKKLFFKYENYQSIYQFNFQIFYIYNHYYQKFMFLNFLYDYYMNKTIIYLKHRNV